MLLIKRSPIMFAALAIFAGGWLYAQRRRIVATVDALMDLCDHLEAKLGSGDDTRRHLLDCALHAALRSPTLH